MTLRLVHRPTRITRPIKPDTAETIAAPPTITDGHVGGMPIQSFLPVIGALSSVIMIVVLRNNNPVFLVVGGRPAGGGADRRLGDGAEPSRLGGPYPAYPA